MVSVEELQKEIAEITKEKVNTQELPSQTPTTTNGQPKEQQAQDAIAMVDSSVIVTTTAKEKDKENTGHKDISNPTTQTQGVPPQITIIDQGRREEDKEEEKSPKEKE